MTQKEIDEIRAGLDSTAPYYVHALLAERDRLTQEVERLKEAALDHDCPSYGMCFRHAKSIPVYPEHCVFCATEKAEAEATRLRGMWEALKAWAAAMMQKKRELGTAWDSASEYAYESVVDEMAELEATPSGPEVKP